MCVRVPYQGYRDGVEDEPFAMVSRCPKCLSVEERMAWVTPVPSGAGNGAVPRTKNRGIPMGRRDA